MSQPSSYTNPCQPHHVCLLKKALYGLKQSPRSWFTELSNALYSFGFTRCISDTSLFVSQTATKTCYVLVYVDDIIIIGSSSEFVSSLITQLNSKFYLKDLGKLSQILGVQATFTSHCLHLSQERYVLDLLEKIGLRDCKSFLTPVLPGRQLS